MLFNIPCTYSNLFVPQYILVNVKIMVDANKIAQRLVLLESAAVKKDSKSTKIRKHAQRFIHVTKTRREVVIRPVTKEREKISLVLVPHLTGS